MTGSRSVDYDHHAQLSDQERLALFGDLQSCPVTHSARHGGFHVVARYDEVVGVLREPETFSSAQGVFLPDLTNGVRTVSLEQDPPEHTATRRLYAEMLSRPNIDRAADDIRALARRYVEELADRGGDFVTAIAHRVPVEAIAVMIGFSGSTVERVRYLTEQLWARLTGDTSKVDSQAPPLSSVFLKELEWRRREPRPDFLTRLTRLTREDLDGQPVTDRFLIAFLTGAMVAGHETTMNASANLAYQLSIDPELQSRLVDDPALISGAIDESLRFRSPVQSFVRTAVRDTEIGGCPVAAGERVMVVFGAANHDPARWESPEVFDPQRAAHGHLGFGWGIHRCVGAVFAKTELTILFEELLRYRIEPAGEAIEGAPASGGAFLGMASLPVRLAPRS